MRNLTLIFLAVILFGCGADKLSKEQKDQIRKEIIRAERDFQKLANGVGIPDAFIYFADDSAHIKRNDRLISGKAAITEYYTKNDYSKISLRWKPDSVEISDDGNLADSYGNYVYTDSTRNDSVKVFKGEFHTTWKKQKNGSWKYIRD